MNRKKEHTGFAIALAWPQTYCKQAGAWYDPITRWLGVNRNNYYKAGHAALVLVDNENRRCHYFDFGRYHSPFQYGRVRSAETDDDLSMMTSPNISEDKRVIENYIDILTELQNNSACHGEGKLFASYCLVNFQSAYKKAKKMQELSPLPYGPFRYKGSNCSRFVNSVIVAGSPNMNHAIYLKYLIPLTPTPINNVNSLNHKVILPKLLKGEAFCPIRKLNKIQLKSTLVKPERNPKIPENAQWLSGEGAGSWFVFEFQDTLLKVIRYSPDGVIECTGLYENKQGEKLPQESSCQITYPSNCKKVYLFDGREQLELSRVFV